MAFMRPYSRRASDTGNQTAPQWRLRLAAHALDLTRPVPLADNAIAPS